jgi:dTDP-4-dehydrorhamnose 3,5-epimerase
MKTRPTAIAGVVVVETERREDHRGAFSRLFCMEELNALMGLRQIVQINHSRTDRIGAARGLHYQRHPHAEMKCIRCMRGKVWDVAVDLRAGSPTLFQWHAEELSPDNGRMLVIPEGCAHGFQTLEAHSELLYLHTAYFKPDSEGGVSPTDPRLGIRWPLPVRDLSDRDRNHALLNADFTGLNA